MNFLQYTNLIKSYNICIFFFYSKECMELFNKIKNIEIPHKNKISFVEIENNISLIKEIKLKSYPFFKIYKDGILIEDIIGTYANIENIIRLHIS